MREKEIARATMQTSYQWDAFKDYEKRDIAFDAGWEASEKRFAEVIGALQLARPVVAEMAKTNFSALARLNAIDSALSNIKK